MSMPGGASAAPATASHSTWGPAAPAGTAHKQIVIARRAGTLERALGCSLCRIRMVSSGLAGAGRPGRIADHLAELPGPRKCGVTRGCKNEQTGEVSIVALG